MFTRSVRFSRPSEHPLGAYYMMELDAQSEAYTTLDDCDSKGPDSDRDGSVYDAGVRA